MNAFTYYGELVERITSHVTDADMFLVQSAVTCCAFLWLLHRAWLTLWKPVPDLINILGVEVPDTPAVSLAGIKADAITLHWTRPGPNKPVLKYHIQVNGVNVGESSRLETAITVTGLKPGHFYNVRVIAVGPNNFQAGSTVIRLRTYGRDGRPQLPNGRVPSNLSIEEQQNGALADSSDESSAPRNQAAGIEAVSVPVDPLTMVREPSTGITGRRNTGGRKHSPSSAAADQAAQARRESNQPEESMQQLTERFEAIRKETEELVGQVAKDSEEYKSQILDLLKERDEKKQTLKEKEEASEKLKKEVHYSERANRQAQNRKSTKEKTLRDKQAEKTKLQEDMIRWKNEIENMKRERDSWRRENEKMAAEKETRTEELRDMIRDKTTSLNGLEEEIRIRGLQIKELEEERKHLLGAQDDEESREWDAAAAQRDIEWEIKEKDLSSKLHDQSVYLRQLQAEFQTQQGHWNALAARHQGNSIMYHGNSSGVDFDPTGTQGKAKSRRSRNRKSRTSTVSSPVASYPIENSGFPSASVFNNLNTTISPTFAPGPYFDLSNDTVGMVPLSEHTVGMTEADIRALTAGAPLSPTATSLLPSNIFEDNDPPSPGAGSTRSFGPALYGPNPVLEDPQSPQSSSRSASLMSSPQTSSHNLPLYGVTRPEFGTESDRRSLKSPRGEFGTLGPPSGSDQLPAHRGFGNMFTFPRQRGKTMADGPALGSLKQGQSQSFPRSLEEPEAIPNRPRRISFSSGWNVMPSLFNRYSTADATEGNAPAPARDSGARRRRGFNMFGNSFDEPSPVFSDRDPSSPRPLSTASSDLPRPSTDSAPFGWPAIEGNVINRNSPLATNWSINAPATWSRNPSRRPSLGQSIHQHGSTTALTSGIANEDDEFLPSDMGQSSPPPVGVIGTRPPLIPETHNSQTQPSRSNIQPQFPLPRFQSRESQSKGEGERQSYRTPNLRRSQYRTQPTILGRFSEIPRHTQYTHPIQHRRLPRLTRTHLLHALRWLQPPLHEQQQEPRERILPPPTFAQRQLGQILSLQYQHAQQRLWRSLWWEKGPSSMTNSDREVGAARDGSFDEYGEGVRGESVASSPMIGSLGSGESSGIKGSGKEGKEGRMSVNWGRFGLKGKGRKERESLDTDENASGRSQQSEAETELGTEDEV